MSSPSQIYILVEDNRQQSFIRRFLLQAGIKQNQMVFAAVPDGHGSGKQWVRKNFAAQVRICRQRNSRASTSVFAVMDADELTVARCLSDLDKELIDSGQQRVDNKHDHIARLIPKWSIETWILFLDSNGAVTSSVHEDEPYKDSKTPEQWSELIPDASKTLYLWSRTAAQRPDNLLDSLRQGLEEIPRALPVSR